jgi:Zn-dependent protease/CBS domain-containing protein
MLQGGISIGRIFGIAIKLHYSWFIIFALVTWTLAASYFPATYPNWSLATKITAGILTSFFFFGSVLLHELMHSVVAQRQGIHIEAITLFVLGGVSQMTGEPKTAKDEFRMAIAGPLSSLVLGGIFWGTWLALRGSNVGSIQFVAGIAYWLGYINLALGVFNLVPGFPLDGGRVLRSLLWWRGQKLQSATRIASNIGRAIGFLFILGGIFLVFTGNWFNGIWFALIGWFLQSAAVGSYRQLILEDMLKGHVASDIMSRDCQIISPDITIEQLVNDNIFQHGHRCFPVASDGRVEGLITLRDIKAVPRDQWSQRLVSQVMTPLERLKYVKPDEDLSTVLQTMAQNDINQVPVVQDNNIIGIVGRDNIIGFINVMGELHKS